MIVATCQIPVKWEKPLENIDYCENLLKEITKRHPGVDIVIFPEFFTYGFSVEGKIFEENEGITNRWMKEAATKYGYAITGSVPVLDDGKIYNRAYFVTPGNQVSFYDKKHLFSYGGENKNFTPGSKLDIIDYKGFKIALQICYDLRFPVYIRNTDNKYDFVINVA
ncbi:MAG: nitrilase family protein, partial [Bacteroidales bacterium]|nr:nitrilase family protein [Bacteroidales bacterium]